MNDTRPSHRRRFLRHAFRVATAGAMPAAATAAQAAVAGGRALSLLHTHTHERIEIEYAVDGLYLPAALSRLDRFLRDHYTGEIGVIDPQLFDLLHRVGQVLGCEPRFEVISGYRCALTNARLRESRGGGVASHSLHMEGRAVDARLPGVPLAELRDAARSLRLGGVGYYPREQFVHLDTGRLRHW
ncbi:MAG: DUF882 domain-containing protein [Burkholderiales bacterium]|nr:DUF882 domain-containing protein [Burkholderiales bacterium]